MVLAVSQCAQNKNVWYHIKFWDHCVIHYQFHKVLQVNMSGTHLEIHKEKHTIIT